MFFHPTRLPVLTEQPTQHVDIMPTILDLVGLQSPKIARFGQSLAAERVEPFLLHNNGAYWLIDDKHVLRTKTQFSRFELFNWQDDPALAKPLDHAEKNQSLQVELKRKVQYFNNALIENKLNW